MINNLDEYVTAYEGKSIYDFDNQVILKWYPNRIIEFTQGAKSLLELGLGHGYTSKIFSSHFKRHVVLEGSPAVINRFKRDEPNYSGEIIETYFKNFKTDEKFDVIVLGFILEHIDNPVQIINYFKNFLSTDGKMFITVPNAKALNRRLGHHAGFLPDLYALSESDLEQGHKRYYTVDSLKEEITKAGFVIEKTEGVYLKPFTTKQILSLNLDQKVIDAMCAVGIDFPELCLGILTQVREK